MNIKLALFLTLTSFMGGGLFYASPVFAQNIDLSHGGQITVTALGGFDWDQNAKSVTAYDQAKAVRGNVTVTADRLVALYRKKANTEDNKQPKPAENPQQKSGDITQNDSGSNEIYRLYAYGHVHIYTNTDQAWGDKAIYDIDQATLVLTGKNMKLTTPQNLMTAKDAMEYHSQTRMSVGRGDATVTNLKDGRRITADVLVGYSKPTDQKDPNAKNNPPNNKQSNDADDMTRSSKLEKVNAFGNVVVRTQTETVRGDRGVYVPDTGIARVVGNVHITRGANQLNGHAAIINMKTGIAHMTEAPGRRVQGLVVPNESNNQQTKPK